MRKLIVAALLFTALACFTGANLAYAGDCGGCKTKCHSCKPKCEPCKPKCEPCKPKCEPCKPKCEPCKPKCDPCKPKCEPCKPKCDPCKPKCEPCGKSKCHSCKPKCNPCENKCGGCHKKCGSCYDKCGCGYKHPYEACWTGSGNFCAGGCCDNVGVCKRSCVTCETVCKKVESCDPCTGCPTVDYVYETVCHEIERPRVIPWWFNEKGDGNIYPEMQDEKKAAEDEKEEAKAE